MRVPACAATAGVCSALLLTGCDGYEESPLAYREHHFGDTSVGDLHARGVRLVAADRDRAAALVATFVN